MQIYKITNTVNGKIYIGQTIQKNPKMRWYAHCDYVRKGRKSYLYDSMRKHGVDKFQLEIIDHADTIDDLNLKEQQWLDYYRSIGIVYNNREAGGNKIHSQESIARMSIAQKKRHKENPAGGWTRIDGGPMKGKSHPKKGKPGKKWSDEAREKFKVIAQTREAKKRLQRESV
jgi:group I intron endonuclease